MSTTQKHKNMNVASDQGERGSARQLTPVVFIELNGHLNCAWPVIMKTEETHKKLTKRIDTVSLLPVQLCHDPFFEFFALSVISQLIGD